MNELHIEVKALDPGQGYLVLATGIVNDEREKRQEHYDTEAEVQARLAQIWQWWANQVNAE